MDEKEIHVNTTLEDAAKEILRHSFAVYRVSEDTTAKIRTAHSSAVTFFRSIDQDMTMGQSGKDAISSNTLLDPYKRIVNGHLLGYNEPSPAKRLYRAYCQSNDQPWPEGQESFRWNAVALAEELHSLLVDCTHYIVEEFSKKNSSSARLSRPSKRVRKINPTEVLLKLAQDSDKSPLDYFFYHNQHPAVANCTEHVDRGVLIVVCLTNVPGLEVCRGAKDNLRFVCPEILVYNANLFQEAEDSCSSLVCIMAGDQLAPLLATAGRTEEVVNQVEAEGMDGLGMSEFPKACLHRVRTPLKRARLSISYELRL
jgi:hypothetical protein